MQSLYVKPRPRLCRARTTSQITQNITRELASVLPSTKISHLSVNYSPVGDEGLSPSSALADTAINTLSFKEAEVSDTAVTELAKILQADKTALRGSSSPIMRLLLRVHSSTLSRRPRVIRNWHMSVLKEAR